MMPEKVLTTHDLDTELDWHVRRLADVRGRHGVWEGQRLGISGGN